MLARRSASCESSPPGRLVVLMRVFSLKVQFRHGHTRKHTDDRNEHLQPDLLQSLTAKAAVDAEEEKSLTAKAALDAKGS